jgi:hypothetical protein
VKMYMLVPARCRPVHGVFPNLFPFISGNPLQALGAVAAFCGIILLAEALLIARRQRGQRLLRMLTAGVGIVSLIVAIIAFLSPLPVVCGGIKVSANVVQQIDLRFLTLRAAVIALCILTLLLLLIGTMVSFDPTQRRRRPRTYPRRGTSVVDYISDYTRDTDALAAQAPAQDQPGSEGGKGRDADKGGS